MASLAAPGLATRTAAPVLYSAYLSKDNLHARPLSARIFHVINYTSAQLHKNASATAWHGSVIRGTAAVISVTGMTLNSVVALVEGVATGVIATLATIVHIATGARSEVLQKYTIKCWAYSFNSSSVLISQIVCLSKGLIFKDHISDALVINIQSVTSDIAAHLLLGLVFNKISNRAISPEAISNFFIDSLRSVAQDLIQAMQNQGLFNRSRTTASTDGFFERYPQHRVTIQNILQRISSNQSVSEPARQQETMTQLRAILTDFMNFAGIAQQIPAVGAAPAQNGVIPLARGSNASEAQYQTRLEELTKESFKQIHRNPELAKLLCNDATAADPIQEGRDALEGFYPEIYIPLANYAQLLEIEQDLICPQRFSAGALARYNTRRAALEAAKTELAALSPAEKQALVKKLLNSDTNIASAEGITTEGIAKIESLFRKIGQLSGDLHQGTLMSQMVINLNTPGQLVTGTSLFQRAVQAAAQEITSAPAPAVAE